MDAPAATAMLAALAQPSRLALFRALVERAPDGATPGDLATALALRPATLSFHLKALAQAGLLAVDRDGRHLHYRAELGAVQALVGFLTDHCCGGQPERCAPACAPSASPGNRATPRDTTP